MSLIERFQTYIKENHLFAPHERILLAVSGGVDSMVMLRLFVEGGYSVGVAHCNFQLRGQEAIEDEEMIREVCAELQLPHYNIRFDTAGEMDRTGESVQMAARRLRYTWFGQLCEEHGYDRIAIAHHADDSIETFFINLLRGTGLRGLTGITAINGRVVRPLLFASRKEISDFARTNRVPYREDSSNRSTKYLRNKIRLGLIPRIREINPRFTQVMSANVHRLTDAQRFISRSIERIRSEVISHEEGGIEAIDPSRIEPGFPVDFVIYEILSSYYGFRGEVIDDLCHSLHRGGSGKRFCTGDRVAYVDRGHILLAPLSDCFSCSVKIEADSQRVYCGNLALSVERLDIDDLESLCVPEQIALIDADKLTFPLTVRRWQEGDSFIPLGMEGHKKVSDFLVDEKVSMARKARQFVVLNGSEIVWVVGRRIDQRYRLSDKSENVLRLIKEID